MWLKVFPNHCAYCIIYIIIIIFCNIHVLYEYLIIMFSFFFNYYFRWQWLSFTFYTQLLNLSIETIRRPLNMFVTIFHYYYYYYIIKQKTNKIYKKNKTNTNGKLLMANPVT